ncbi:hypothetical protein IFM89_013624 [Coptis chinensis]|uniref:Uncharacterized protein n=1 Tax=Coptis chinensis TaxID=261450 RepID=A0A835IPS0_9MAGN|nr:hypothetical protein IFM89_013624 [Coptis chinensis]
MEMKRWLLFFHLFCLLVKLQTSSSTTSCQQEKDRVLELPGLSVNVSFEHYSGYVTVNEESGRNLFYWFFEAVEDPSSKPLVIWLQGGPGCSSVGFGEAEEIGPFHINPDGKTLCLNPYSWNQGKHFSYSSLRFGHLSKPYHVLAENYIGRGQTYLQSIGKIFSILPSFKLKIPLS